MIPAGVDGCSHQVVRYRDGVHVAGEMEVELVHGDDLAVPATCRTALYPEGGAHAWLSDASDRLVPHGTETLDQPDRGGRLALAQRGGSDGGDDHVLAHRVAGDPAQGIEMDLRLGGSVRNDLFFFEAEVTRHVTDRLQFGGAGDLEVARHVRQRVGHAVVLAGSGLWGLIC